MKAAITHVTLSQIVRRSHGHPAAHSAAIVLAVSTLFLIPVTAQAQRRTSARDTIPSDSSARHNAHADTAQRLRGEVITGTRLSQAADRTAARVDHPDLTNVPPGPAAAADILARLPGVSSIDDQGSRIQPTLTLRGFTLSPVVGVPQGVSVFLDGVRINEPDAQELNFDLIPMEAVTSASLIRGPATLFGKNTLAGALLLTTERGDTTPHASATIEDGAFGFRSATATASGVAPALGGIDGYIMGRASNERGWRDATQARSRMLFANIGKKTDASDVTLTAMYAHDAAFLAGSLPESWITVDPQANYTDGDFFEPELLHLALRGERALSLGAIRANLFFRRNNVQQFNANIDAPSTRAFVDNRSAGGTVEWSVPTHIGRHDLAFTLGSEYSRNDVDYHIFDEKTSAAADLPTDCDQMSGLCDKVHVPEDDASLYAQGMLAVSSKLSLTVAARADYVRIPFRDLRDPSNDGTSVFRQMSPRIGATYQLDARTSAYASVGTGFRAPAALELACADVNAPCALPSALGDDPPLEPVTVRSYEVGLSREFAHEARFGVSAYRTDVRDEIVFVASSVTAGFFQNIPRTRRQGIEITGEAGLGAGFTLDASYNYLNSTYESTVALASELAGNVVHPGDKFPLSPDNQASFSIQNTRAFRTSVLHAQLSIRGVSSQFLRGDEANRERQLPGYATTDARVEWQAHEFTLSGYVTNLLDRSYDTFGVFGENPKGPLGGTPPAAPTPERFLTPAYPRALTVSLAIHM